MKTNAYIPTILAEKIAATDYKRKDDLYVIVDGIYRKQIHLPSKLFKNYLFVELSNAHLSKFIASPKNIVAAIKFLKENEFIMVNDKYSTGAFSKSYKIKAEYLGNPIQVELTDKGICTKFKLHKEELRKFKVANNEQTKKKYFKEFNLDTTGAIAATFEEAKNDLKKLCSELGIKTTDKILIDLLNDRAYKELAGVKYMLSKSTKFYGILHRLMSHQMCVRGINDGFLYFKRNNTNGRLDSNLSNLPTYLRKFISSDKNLFNLDIKNSQPFFLYCTLKNETWMINQEELDKFKSLVVDGRLYDFIADLWNKSNFSTKNRTQGKQMIFKILFSKVSSFASYKNIFRAEFPTIMEWIDFKNAESNSTVANMMTMKESFTILDCVKPKLTKLGIEPYTIHDSFVCSEDELPVVKSVLLSTCEEMFGIAPSVHENNILEEGVDVTEDELIDEDDFFFEDACPF